MSKASDAAKNPFRSDCMWPKPFMILGGRHVVASVRISGDLVLENLALIPVDALALALADWIYDTFGEETNQRCTDADVWRTEANIVKRRLVTAEAVCEAVGSAVADSGGEAVSMPVVKVWKQWRQACGEVKS